MNYYYVDAFVDLVALPPTSANPLYESVWGIGMELEFEKIVTLATLPVAGANLRNSTEWRWLFPLSSCWTESPDPVSRLYYNYCDQLQ